MNSLMTIEIMKNLIDKNLINLERQAKAHLLDRSVPLTIVI